MTTIAHALTSHLHHMLRTRRGRPGVRACVLSLALTALAAPGQAHPGGHALEPGNVLTLWTDPATHHRMPGSLLFVADGRVRVEDVAGTIHTWSLASLTPEDRARATTFRARVEALHLGVPGTSPRSHPLNDVPWPAMLAAVAGMVWTARVWLTHGRVTRLQVAGALAAVAVACGKQASTGTSPSTPTTSTTGTTNVDAASYFAAFPAHVRTRQDASNLYVESDGLADHTMMVGIRSWQQQVPLPANYTGTNAWTIPLKPRLASQPVSARTGLFRGAIALAVNGVPIFNALNNRGDDAFLFGELDDFGGHAGRADDYHYHTAPLFLSAAVGATKPVAIALDGFLLYGSVEPDGSPMLPLDDYNGHTDSALGYHYHGTRTYPYINGGMKGVVQVSDQVEPQPSLTPVRPAGTPLTGAVITRHVATGATAWTLEYQIAGRTSRVDYRIEGTRVTFVFTDSTGAARTEVYTR